MITLGEWAEIRRLHRSEGLPIKAIARKLGISKNTVRRALRAEEAPRYQRPARGSIVDAVEPAIREQLRLDPTMPATVVAERIGWERSITVLRERVTELRPVYLPQDPAGRTSYDPGERAQNDFWFPPAEIPVGPGVVASGKDAPPVLVMASGYSRWMLALMLPSRHAEDLVLGTWELLQRLGGVPKQMVWDNEGGVGKYRGRGRPPLLSRQFAEFRGLLGCEVVVLPPREPEHKGIVERNNDYLETSFLPGRSFVSPGTSTRRSATGRGWRTRGASGSWAALRPTGSLRTGPRWRRCRRSRRPRWAGITASGCPAITTCGSTAATTRWTRR